MVVRRMVIGCLGWWAASLPTASMAFSTFIPPKQGGTGTKVRGKGMTWNYPSKGGGLVGGTLHLLDFFRSRKSLPRGGV